MSEPSEEKAHILIVDDQEANISIMRELLEEAYRVTVAMDGDQALERIRAAPRPDLILLDIVMPGLDGFEVCEELQRDPATADIPVIFITAMRSAEDEVRALELGGVDFISRPISPAVIWARVKNQVTLLRQKRQLERMHEKVLALSITDGLTEIANRRRFQEFLQQEWHRAQREGTPIGLLMVDIDHFKRYNDHYGHGAGDLCLKRVATAIQAELHRPDDLVARYGGEEFACILPGTDLEGVRLVATRLLEGTRQLAIPHAHSETAPMVTLSVGGSALVPISADNQERLTRIADDLLYVSKKAGRNCSTVRAAPPLPA